MRPAVFFLAIVALALGASGLGASAESIDPASKYAWGENVGWINAQPSGPGGPGVTVGRTGLTGYMWGENIGWISMSCHNQETCGAAYYGVSNDGAGHLAGYAWGEDVGWISLSCQNQGTCATANYGVNVDPPTGAFSGYGWGENIGWISFSCQNTSSCGTASYGVAAVIDSDFDGCPDATEIANQGVPKEPQNPNDAKDFPDADRSGKVQYNDFLLMLDSWNKKPSSGLPPYDPRVDFDMADPKVNYFDFLVLLDGWNRHCP